MRKNCSSKFTLQALGLNCKNASTTTLMFDQPSLSLPNSMAFIVEFPPSGHVLIFECDDRGRDKCKENIPQKKSDRMFEVRRHYPEHTVLVCMRQQPIANSKALESACDREQIKHCREVANTVTNLLERAKNAECTSSCLLSRLTTSTLSRQGTSMRRVRGHRRPSIAPRLNSFSATSR